MPSPRDMINALKGDPRMVVTVLHVTGPDGRVGSVVVSNGVAETVAGFMSIGGMLTEWAKGHPNHDIPDEVMEAAATLARMQDVLRAEVGQDPINRHIVEDA